jgi:ribosomal protein S18 acetylase RimI-like enzyme
MTNFHPGRIVKKQITKTGAQAVIRYPQWQDLDQIIDYTNRLSQEDTYVTLSGEELTREDEAEFLNKLYKGGELKNRVSLVCLIDGQLAGLASIKRKQRSRTRRLHVGAFSISVAEQFRGQGVGSLLAKTVIEEAKKELDWLKIIVLHVYEENKVGQNLYKKLGFKRAGMVPKEVAYRGELCGDIRMYLEV